MELPEEPRKRAEQMAAVRWHSNFQQINPESPSILPLDGAARIVSGFTENMSDKVVNRFR